MATPPDNPLLKGLLQGADHIDCKVFDGPADQRTFIAGLMGWMPGWLRMLYTVRGWLAGVLGLKHEMPPSVTTKPADVPMAPGATIKMWTVKAAREGEFWAAGINDKHLEALLVDVCHRQGNGFRHHLVTIVHYHNKLGPLYFNIIRPFHHLVVWGLGRRAAKGV